MKRFSWLIFGVILSPEMLAVWLTIVASLLWPDALSFLGRKLEADGEIWKYLPTLTIALAAYSFNLSSQLRAPLQDDANKCLYEWPLYQYLVDRVYVAMGYSVAAVMGSLCLWVFGNGFSEKFVGVVFISATTVASATALTMLLAKQKLVEILTRFR